MNPSDIVLSGSLLLSLPLALLAGLVSFISPCVLPLVPGYLGYVSGMATVPGSPAATGSASTATKNRIVLGTALFVLGFTVVFVAIGTVFGSFGTVMLMFSRTWLQPIFGVLIFALGLVLIGQFSFLQRTIKPHFTPRAGLAFAPILGMVFGLGWTPCVGPTLGAVITLALNEGGFGQGALLAFIYSLGLGIPFILLAAGFSWATRSVSFVRKHIRAFNLAGGAMLMLLGILLVTGIWNIFAAYIQGVFGVFTPAL